MKPIFCYAVIILSCILLFLPLFEEGFPVLLDNPVHLSETLYLIENLLPEYHSINGWCLADFAGFPILLYHYIFGKLLIAGMNIFFGIQVITAYKLMMLVSLIFPACTLFFLFSKICGKLTGFFSALFFILHIHNLEKILQGMWNIYFSLGFLPLFIFIIIRMFDSGSFKYVPYAAILLNLTIISHQFVAIAEFIFAVIYFVVSLIIDRKNSLRFFFMLLTVGILSAGMSLFFTFPFIDTGEWLSSTRTFGAEQIRPVSSFYYFLKDLLNIPETISIRGQLLGGNIREFLNIIFNNIWINIAMLFLDIMAMIGILNMLYEKKESVYKKASISFAFLTGFMLIAASRIWRAIPLLNNSRFAGEIADTHFIIFSHIGLLYFAAFGIKYLLGLKAKMMRFTPFIMFALFLAGLMTLSSYFKEKQFFLTSSNLSEYADIKRFWNWTGRNIDGSKMRIWVQRTKGNSKIKILKRSHILGLSFYFSGVNHIGLCPSAFPNLTEKLVNTEGGKILGMNISNLHEDVLVKRLYLLNAGYVAVVENNLKKLIGSFNLFEKAADFELITVFKLKNFNPSWTEFIQGNGIASVKNFNSQNILIKITTFGTDNIIRIKMQNHPYWKAYLDGVPTKLEDDEFGLMKIMIKDKGQHNLKLIYNSKNNITLIISAMSLLSCILMIFSL